MNTGEADTDKTPDIENGAEKSAHQSFAQRLMTVQASFNEDARTMPDSSVRPRPPDQPRAAWELAVGKESWGGFTANLLDSSILEARGRTHLYFGVYIAAVCLTFIPCLFSAIFFISSLISGAEWQRLVSTGLMTAGLATLAAFILYRPPASVNKAAGKVAQLEAARAYLDKYPSYWESFFRYRGASPSPLTADEVAAAVASLTAASHSILFDVEANEAPSRNGEAREASTTKGESNAEQANPVHAQALPYPANRF
jgi:hypothetical protein